jgi:hypothetical protein
LHQENAGLLFYCCCCCCCCCFVEVLLIKFKMIQYDHRYDETYYFYFWKYIFESDKRLFTNTVQTIYNISRHNQHNGFATSMDPDQPAHPRSLIRIYGVRLQTLLQVQNWLRTAWIVIRPIMLVLSWRGSFLFTKRFQVFINLICQQYCESIYLTNTLKYF